VINMAHVPQFDPAANPATYLWAAVSAHVEARIAAEELTPGTRLPGEDDMADEYQVSLGTARRALKDLRDRGVIVTLPGKGSFAQGR
jgi:GntR family transcriptional regulator